jgi:hypothetical protein
MQPAGGLPFSFDAFGDGDQRASLLNFHDGVWKGKLWKGK